MGSAKHYQEEAETRGWNSVDKSVCMDCVTDSTLADAVGADGGNDRCDYCGRTPSAPNGSAPVDVILDLIAEGLYAEFEDPINMVAFSSADGGYQMDLLDTSDLLYEHEVTDNEDLLNDLVQAIRGEKWVQRDPYAASPTDALRWGWAAFRTYVKRQRRYTFLMRDAAPSYGGGEISMDGVPAAVAAAVETAGQIRVLKAGSRWWRVRPHPPGEVHRSAAALGSPPEFAARDNRMTAKGIGAFYGASSAAGAQAEVAGYADPSLDATIGEFAPVRDISVVDLTDASNVPSLFDATKRHLRAEIAFMREFIENVATIADPSDRQNLDYIPTQIIAEFLRYELSGPAGPVTGILWRSSKNRSVENCVIFAGNDQMADEVVEGSNQLLVLNSTSVRVLTAPL